MLNRFYFGECLKFLIPFIGSIASFDYMLFDVFHCVGYVTVSILFQNAYRYIVLCNTVHNPFLDSLVQ